MLTFTSLGQHNIHVARIHSFMFHKLSVLLTTNPKYSVSRQDENRLAGVYSYFYHHNVSVHNCARQAD